MAITIAPRVASEEVLSALEARWGMPHDRSEAYAFDAFTRYYAEEMGTDLLKWLAVFAEPFPPEHLADAKRMTNEMERLWADAEGRRAVNLDPGYLTPSALVLASTKPASHRIYLRDGIYAEVTLRYERGAYAPLPWTYPDYRQPLVREFLARCRPKALEFHARRRDG